MRTRKKGIFNTYNRIRDVFLVLVIILMGLGACTYDTIEYEAVETPDSVSFSNDIIPLFQTSCAISGCHSSGGIVPDLSEDNAYNSLVFFNYVDTVNDEQSTIYVKINSGSMAQYATDNDRALILKWIEQGAQNN